jgi:hypothetical protein
MPMHSKLPRTPGFALAATTVMLVERFGHVAAYWFMAAGLAAIGLIAAVVVSAKEDEEELGEQKADAADTQQIGGGATAQAMAQAPLAMLGALFSAPGGATSLLKVGPYRRAQLAAGAAAGDDRAALLAGRKRG